MLLFLFLIMKRLFIAQRWDFSGSLPFTHFAFRFKVLRKLGLCPYHFTLGFKVLRLSPRSHLHTHTHTRYTIFLLGKHRCGNKKFPMIPSKCLSKSCGLSREWMDDVAAASTSPTFPTTSILLSLL